MTTLDWKHRIDEIAVDGRTWTREANAEECAALVKAAGIVSCELFSANYTLTALPNDQFKLAGRMTVCGNQACVVTLEPVTFDLHLDVMVMFVAQESIALDDEEIEHEALSLEDVEPYSGTELNVGDVFYEHFCASLDPYPRAEGASFDAATAQDGDDDEKTHPFAVLKQLKRKS